VIGYSISIWALCYLRRSFALLVAVRTVVLGGPYAYVRHPIYLGYALDLLGLLLVTGSLGWMLLGAGFATLMIYRARIEEQKLSEASSEYRQYIKQTAFLFPRWRM
jgi:protein-S-isoprenylcysteine O-methyltransferase Ste14